MSKLTTCFLVGHSDAEETIQSALETVIEEHIIDFGVTNFYVGTHGNFDRIAAAALRSAKQRYPTICLNLLLSYHPAEHPIKTPEGFDGTYYPFVTAPPRQYAIVRANEKMIRASGYMIAYAWHIGKTRDFVELAEKVGVRVTNIAECTRYKARC